MSFATLAEAQGKGREMVVFTNTDTGNYVLKPENPKGNNVPENAPWDPYLVEVEVNVWEQAKCNTAHGGCDIYDND